MLKEYLVSINTDSRIESGESPDVALNKRLSSYPLSGVVYASVSTRGNAIERPCLLYSGYYRIIYPGQYRRIHL